MNRIALIGVLVLAAGGAALAVGSNLMDGRAAATVNGSEISEDDLEGIMASFVENEALMADIDPTAVQGQVAGTYSSAMAAFFLTNQIEQLVLDQAAADLGVEVTDAHRAQAEVDLALQYANGSFAAPQAALDQAVTIGMQSLDAFDSERRAELVQAQALEIALGEHLVDDADIEAAVADGVATCASHILLTSAADAQTVLEEIEGGMDFATAATTYSIDQGSPGGDLGCQQPGTFVPEFEEALASGEPGELVGPIETQFGFHLIELRDPRPVLEIELGRRAVADLLAQELPGADVEVDSRWGTWALTENRYQVTPPRAPEPEPFDFAA